MHVVTRFAYLGFWVLTIAWLSGCSGGGGGPTNPPPANQNPTITLLTHPDDSVAININPNFTWIGSDSDGSIAQYYAGLDDQFTSTTTTAATYTGLSISTTYAFKVFAVDNEGLHSDTADWTFYMLGPPPLVTIMSWPDTLIEPTDPAIYTWQGSDPDNNIAYYMAGLDGNFQYTTSTSATYTGFLPASYHLLKVFAVDAEAQHSDTAEWGFYTTGLLVYGEGINDDDGDGFWSQYSLRWRPSITTGAPVMVRLVYALQPSFFAAPEIKDSTDLIPYNPTTLDTLTAILPAVTKTYYDIRAELHDAFGALLVNIPYDSILSLTQAGLEDVEGFHAWFDDAWTANAVDTLPAGAPDGYYESIDVWWDVDAYPDEGQVKVAVFQRNSAGVELPFYQSVLHEVSGSGNSDAFGMQIIAGTTLDEYDYRLDLLDQNNNLLDQLNYGDDPDLMDIPLGNPAGIQSQNRVQFTLQK